MRRLGSDLVRSGRAELLQMLGVKDLGRRGERKAVHSSVNCLKPADLRGESLLFPASLAWVFSGIQAASLLQRYVLEASRRTFPLGARNDAAEVMQSHLYAFLTL